MTPGILPRRRKPTSIGFGGSGSGSGIVAIADDGTMWLLQPATGMGWRQLPDLPEREHATPDPQA